MTPIKISVTKVEQIIVYIWSLQRFQFQKDFPETIKKVFILALYDKHFYSSSKKYENIYLD